MSGRYGGVTKSWRVTVLFCGGGCSCGACEEAVRRREWSGHLQTEKHQSAVLALAMHNQQRTSTSSLEMRVRTLEGQLAATESTCAGLQDQVLTLRGELEASQAACTTLKKNSDKLKSICKQTTQELDMVKRAMQMFEHQNEKLRAGLKRVDPVSTKSAATLRALTQVRPPHAFCHVHSCSRWPTCC